MSYIGKGVEVVTFNTATTLDVAGNITVGGTVDGRDVATDGTKLDTITSGAIADILQDTTPQLGGNLDLNTSNVIGTGNINVTGSITGTSFVSTGDMSFTNNSKAIFGTSPSLEIYHDGSNSILDDVGAGNFKMQLAGSDKLEVTSTGVDVTGGLNTTGNVGIGNTIPSSFNAFANQLVVGDGLSNAGITIYASTSSASSLSFADGTVGDASYRGYIYYNHATDSMGLYTAGANERLKIDSSGNVGIDFTPKTMHANVTSSLNVGSGTLFQRTKDTYLASNTYYNASDAGTSISTGYGLAYYQDVTNGAHKWFTSAASAGSADAPHSFTIPMTLDSSGNVGIGTTTNNQSSSTASVTLNAASGMSAYELRNADVFSGYVGHNGTNMYLVNAKNGSLGLFTNNAERLLINSSGNVGIGVSSMTNILVLPNAAYFAMQDAGGAESLAIRANASNAMEFLTGGGEKMRIDSSGNVGIGVTPATRFDVGDSSSNTVTRVRNLSGAGTNTNATIQASTASNYVNLLVNEQYNYSQLQHGGNLVNHYSDVDNHHFRTKGASYTLMTIDSSGRVTMPYQPVFSANRSGLGTVNNINSNVHFTPVVNQGNHWNTSTDIFTCPVAGKYWVSVYNLNYTAVNSGPSQIEIRRNNGTIFNCYQESPSGTNYHNSSASGVLACAANDTITFFSPQGVVYDGSYCGATVYLIG